MRKMIYGGFFLAMMSILTISCSKEQNELNENTPTLKEKENTTNNFNQKAISTGIRIFTVEIHRKVGKTNKYGQPCECTICTGFCDFRWFPDFSFSGSEEEDATLALQAIDENLVRMYFFDSLDLDGAYTDDLGNFLFHIDENIYLNDGISNSIIFSGEYRLYMEGGILQTDEGDFEYNSFIDVEAEY